MKYYTIDGCNTDIIICLCTPVHTTESGTGNYTFERHLVAVTVDTEARRCKVVTTYNKLIPLIVDRHLGQRRVNLEIKANS